MSKPYNELYLKTKIKVINFLKNNSEIAAAENFQIWKSCVSNISFKNWNIYKYLKKLKISLRNRKFEKKPCYFDAN